MTVGLPVVVPVYHIDKTERMTTPEPPAAPDGILNPSEPPPPPPPPVFAVPAVPVLPLLPPAPPPPAPPLPALFVK